MANASRALTTGLIIMMIIIIITKKKSTLEESVYFGSPWMLYSYATNST